MNFLNRKGNPKHNYIFKAIKSYNLTELFNSIKYIIFMVDKVQCKVSVKIVGFLPSKELSISSREG